MPETANENNRRSLQFSLRQLLLGVTLLAVIFAAGRWLYLKYVYAIPLALGENLADYVGRNVAFNGRFEDFGKGSPSEFVYFGNEPVGFYWDGGIPPHDGQTIYVTGALVIASRYDRDCAGNGKHVTYCLRNAEWHR